MKNINTYTAFKKFKNGSTSQSNNELEQSLVADNFASHATILKSVDIYKYQLCSLSRLLINTTVATCSGTKT